MLFIKDTLVSTPIPTPSEHVFEPSVWCEVELPGDKLDVGVCYRSTSSTDTNNQELLNLLSSAVDYTGSSKLLLMGNLNYPESEYDNYTVNAGEASDPYRFFTKTQDLFLRQHITENTRMRQGNSPSFLDLMFVNEDNLLDQVSYGAPDGKSDHVSLNFNYTTRIEEEQSDVI